MALSTQTVVAPGNGLVFLALSMDYLNRSEISVFLNSELTTAWSWVGATERSIQFNPTVPAGTVVLVKRTTNIDPQRHPDRLGAAFTAQSLDESLKQTLLVAQEAREGNMSGEFYGPINMHFNKITNVADATNPSDVPTFRQVLNTNAASAASAAQAAASAVEADNFRGQSAFWYNAGRDIFLGSHPAAPTSTANGTPIAPGMWYLNTTYDITYVRGDTDWQAAPQGPQGIQGIPGPVGPPGPEGPPGDTTLINTKVSKSGDTMQAPLQVNHSEGWYGSYSGKGVAWGYLAGGLQRHYLGVDGNADIIGLYGYNSVGSYLGYALQYNATQGWVALGARLVYKDSVMFVDGNLNAVFIADRGDIGSLQMTVSGGRGLYIAGGQHGQRITAMIQNHSSGNSLTIGSDVGVFSTGVWSTSASACHIVEAIRIGGNWFCSVTAYG